MSTDVKLAEEYLRMKKNLFEAEKKLEMVQEAIDNSQRLVRFILPARVDMSFNQDDIETVYSYRDYANDIDKGVAEKQIILKLHDLVEDMARDRVTEVNAKSDFFDVRLTDTPNIKEAQMYRFSFEDLIDEYKELYDEEQQNKITQELADNPQP